MTHWYDTEGDMHYGATLKEARENGYLPSVTSVDSEIIRNQGLENWKVNQAIMSALTLPRDSTFYPDDGWLDDESDEDYIKRIKADSMEQARKAARLGNVLHKMAERYASGKPLFFHGLREDVWECFKPVEEWIVENVYNGEAEKIFVGNGYAGKADLFCDYDEWNGKECIHHKLLIDYKSTFLTEKDITKKNTIYKSKIYPSWGRQLAALNKVANADIVMSVIISTNPDFTGVWTYEWSQEELDKAWVQFSGALQIYKSVKGL